MVIDLSSLVVLGESPFIDESLSVDITIAVDSFNTSVTAIFGFLLGVTREELVSGEVEEYCLLSSDSNCLASASLSSYDLSPILSLPVLLHTLFIRSVRILL